MKIKVKKGEWKNLETNFPSYVAAVATYTLQKDQKNGKDHPFCGRNIERIELDSIDKAKAYVEEQYEKYVLSLIEVEE